MNAQVFLGGSCGVTTWRRDVAIPLLTEAGVSYFDPQLEPGAWTSEREAEEMRAKSGALALVFIVSGETCGVAAVAEASYLIAARRPLALMVEDVVPGSCIDGRSCDAKLAADLNRGRIFLRTMATVHGVPLFQTVTGAVHEAIRLVREARSHLTLSEVERIAGEISWKARQFRVCSIGDGFLVWIEGRERDAKDGSWICAKGRPWFVHRTESPSQVVQTLLKAALTWEEHEAREHFRYRGEPIFGAHASLDELLALRRAVKGGPS